MKFTNWIYIFLSIFQPVTYTNYIIGRSILIKMEIFDARASKETEAINFISQ